MYDYPNAHELVKWVQLREKARTSPTGCGDPRIDNYRYCNVRREDDRVTKEIYAWLAPHVGHPMFIPNVIMGRLFNSGETLRRIGFQPKLDPPQIRHTINKMKEAGIRVFNPAYIVSTNGRPMDKVEYLLSEVLPFPFNNPLKLDAAELDTMWYRLTDVNGIGSFMAAQVIADLKMFDPWSKAPDYWTFVAPGPGSMRGLNRLRGLDANAQKYNQKAFSMAIQPVRAIIESGTGIKLCAQNTQNCLCEFDKFMRLTNGEGRPKQLYQRAV